MFDNRDYHAHEILADGIVHGVAILASVAAASALIALASLSLQPAILIALIVYSLTTIAMFSFSAAYNIIPHKPSKPLLRRFDQAAIFLKIAGTYTPLTILIGTMFSYVVLVAVWIVALAGVALKMIGQMRRDRYSIPLYLILGWASLALAWPIAQTMPTVDALLILVGGLLYTAGLVFHTWDKLKYQNAIWHGFVVLAASCHFTAVAHASFAVGA